MRYPNVTPAVFLARPNRFVAQVLLDGETVTRPREEHRPLPGTAGAGHHGIPYPGQQPQPQDPV